MSTVQSCPAVVVTSIKKIDLRDHFISSLLGATQVKLMLDFDNVENNVRPLGGEAIRDAGGI
jgi:hypothetical protein